MIQAINNIAEMLKTILNVIPQIFDYIIEGINNAISFGKSLVEAIPNVINIFNFVFPIWLLPIFTIMIGMVVFLRIMGRD